MRAAYLLVAVIGAALIAGIMAHGGAGVLSLPRHILQLRTSAVAGSGVIVAQQREVGDFEGIVLQGSGELSVRVGQPQSVAVEIDDNLQELIETQVCDGRLVIKNLKSYRSQPGLRVRITVPTLSYLDIAGAGDVQLDNLDSDEFEVQLNGSGDLSGHGRVERLSVDVNGSGSVNFSDIVSTDATVRIEGSGDVRVYAVEHLAASIHGSGDIRYRGSPEVSRSVHGSGDIEPLSE